LIFPNEDEGDIMLTEWESVLMLVEVSISHQLEVASVSKPESFELAMESLKLALEQVVVLGLEKGTKIIGNDERRGVLGLAEDVNCVASFSDDNRSHTAGCGTGLVRRTSRCAAVGLKYTFCSYFN
jgi:hypothetical protein